MSYEADEIYAVYNVIIRRARKAHRCCACRETIARTHLYARVHIVDSEGAEQLKRCLRCQAMHEAIILQWRYAGEYMWPDERLDCGEDWRSEHGFDPSPEITRLAFLTAEEVQRELAPKFLGSYEDRTRTEPRLGPWSKGILYE